ncbi:MAG TPA: hypothetical protein VER76_05580, partial [Pyrinomonadaceae bacterium]|nr:hypothetical protein [Pyrinomonadaceae bacterium]
RKVLTRAGERLNETASTSSSTTTRATAAQQDDGAAQSHALMDLWWERHASGLVRYDSRLLVLHAVGDACGEYGWGTVFYSKAREDYKTRVGSLPENQAATFDLELMSRLQLARAGGLNVAANPNSIVPGHLVIWPEEKRAELTHADVLDLSRLARAHGAWTFIHNMEQAAASIVDWAHFQAYPWEFPMSHGAAGVAEMLYESGDFRVSRLAESYPAYVLAVESKRTENLAAWLFEMLSALARGSAASGERRVPCNVVWRGASAWLIPRSLAQSALAARYVGAREMGGRVCLPHADSLRRYLPDALAAEVRGASVAGDAEVRAWCEQAARETANRLCAGGAVETA